MLIESDFFVGEHLRWNLGWASPNYAGAFVAMLLALSFGLSGSRWRWGFFVLELGGLFLLAKTYSRGALVAWSAAWLFGVLSTGRLFAKSAWLWLARLAALGIILYSVGFQWSRVDAHRTDTIQADRSVGNRLTLWKGGLRMVAAAPLSGWGAGESGRAYQQWFQDLEREERFTTMVNSYLSVAVEYGLPVFVICLFILCLPVVWAWQLARAGSFLAMALGASLVSWLVANGFSTLWIEWRLWIVPGIICIFLTGYLWTEREVQLKAIMSTGILALVTTVVLYTAGSALSKDKTLVISPRREGVVMTSKNTASAKWHIWPDEEVLGGFYGKELRRWLIDKESPLCLVVHSSFPEKTRGRFAEAKGAMFFGKQAARVGIFCEVNCGTLYIIHPTVSPPDETAVLPKRIFVLFPEIDEVGNRLVWERWAKLQGAEFSVSKGSGVDIRLGWPEVLGEVKAGALGR